MRWRPTQRGLVLLVQVFVYRLERSKESNEAIIQLTRTLQRLSKISATELIEPTERCRTHGPVLVRALHPRDVLVGIDPERKPHPARR